MTNKEFIARTISTLEQLQKQEILAYPLGDNAVEAFQYAIQAVREKFVRQYKQRLSNNFEPFSHRNFDYLKEDVYIHAETQMAVVKDNEEYYIVKILNPESYRYGILQTESHDDFPFHVYPDSYTRYPYPELAMVDYLANDVWLNEEIN